VAVERYPAMPTRPKPASPSNPDVLQAILRELQTLNRTAGEIAARLSAQAEADMDPGRPIDPGDSVPPGVAPRSPVPLTPEDEKARRALERLPRRRRGGETRA
jgi:hypothetical protein